MRAVPVSILSFFALVWLSAGLATGGQWAPLPMLAAAGISASLVWSALRADRLHQTPALPAAERKRINRLVTWASAAEGIAIFVTVNVLINLGLAAYQLCAVAIIVGLHFIPLSRIPRAGLYNVTAACMVALGLLGCVLPAAVRPLVVGVGAACICWLTAASALVRWREAITA